MVTCNLIQLCYGSDYNFYSARISSHKLAHIDVCTSQFFGIQSTAIYNTYIY